MGDEIERALLRKLAKHGYWAGRHTSFDNLHKGFPKHLANNVKEVARDLIKRNILIPKPTSYGLHVSLNPRMKDLIEEIIGVI